MSRWLWIAGIFVACTSAHQSGPANEPPTAEVVTTAHDSGGFTARLRLHPSAKGLRFELRSGATVRALVESETRVRGTEVDIAIAGLGPGKYSVVVNGPGSASAAPLLRLPFWIESEPFDWRGALIYMVLVDRFKDGNPANNPAPRSDVDPAADFHGGDIAGITEEIEAGTFDRLGVRALWLSPVVQNADAVNLEGGHGVSAYHGYWPVRGRAVDTRFGSEAELDALIAAAHGHGIRVLFDFVVNHVHQDHEYVAAHPEWFRQSCKCGTPGCDWTEHRLDCVFHPTLPDVDWTNPAAAQTIIDDAVYWLDRFDADGLRIDAVKHVEDSAIEGLGARIAREFEQAGTDYFLVGETAMGWRGHNIADNASEYGTISRYIGPGKLDGQFDFVLYHASAYRVWADRQFGMLHLDYWTQQSQVQYPEGSIMTPFVGSHDSSRLLSLCDRTSSDDLVHHKWADQGLPARPERDEPYRKAELALVWLLTVPGAPLMYYGDEYGEFGGADPDNRHMWRGPEARTEREQGLFAVVSRAGLARARSKALRLGDYRSLSATETALVFARTTSDDIAVVAINLDDKPVTLSVKLPPASPEVATLSDAMHEGSSVPVVEGTLTLTLQGSSTQVLLPN